MKKLYSLDECQLDELASIRGGEAPDRVTNDDYIGVIGSVGSDGSSSIGVGGGITF